jgi:RNA polymerase sigma-70 factor (ECF subfamily)
MSTDPALTADVTNRLVGSHQQFLAFLERRLGDRTLAEDILQDAFVKSIEKGEQVRDDEAAVASFYRLLRKAVIDHHRRGTVKNRALELLAGEIKDAVAPPPEVRDAICSCVGELAANLKPEYAEAIQRVEVDGVPVQQFAGKAPASQPTTLPFASSERRRVAQAGEGVMRDVRRTRMRRMHL